MSFASVQTRLGAQTASIQDSAQNNGTRPLPTAGGIPTTEKPPRALGTQQCTKMLPHPIHPSAESSSTSRGVTGTVIKLYKPGLRNNSWFPHRTKVGCSRLALVLMIHHFLRFSRKNDAWHPLGCDFQRYLLLPGQVRGEDQDSTDSDNNSSCDRLPNIA